MQSPDPMNPSSDPERLEGLWQGDFGNTYTERNAAAGDDRLPFWRSLLKEYPCERVLEVGCNLGGNLRHIASLIPPRCTYGIDVNESALGRLRSDVPGVNAIWGVAREIPYRDRFFDLVFTAGVLIHQPPDSLPHVMDEVVRCSRKYVLAMEYFAEQMTEVAYRGQTGALFKADYGKLYQERHPKLRLLKKDFVTHGTGWTDVTVWLFELTG